MRDVSETVTRQSPEILTFGQIGQTVYEGARVDAFLDSL